MSVARGSGEATARGSDGTLPRWEGRRAAEWADRLGAATVEFHDRIDSTSDQARRLVDDGRPLPALVVAERQARGRGRMGRRWESDTARGLWFTVAHGAGGQGGGEQGAGGHGAGADGRGSSGRVAQGHGAGVLPLRAGLAVAVALEAVAPSVRIRVKWPNDLLVEGRKVGGILCERASGAVLVGVGLNLNHRAHELPEVTPPATSLRLESGRWQQRGQVLERALDALATVWKRPAARIPADELDALNARSALGGRPLSVSGVVRDSSRGPRAVEGFAAEAVGLRADGSLEVRDRAGRHWRVIAGTVENWS